MRRYNGEEAKLRSSVEALRPWETLDLPLSMGSTATTRITLGMLPAAADLGEAQKALAEAAPESQMYEISADREQHYVLLICMKDELTEALAALRTFGFTLANLGGTPGTAKQNIDSAQQQIADVIRKREQAEADIAAFAPHRDAFKLCIDRASVRLGRAEAEERLVGTESVVCMRGWLLGRVAEEHDLLIAADEIYTTYLYEGDFIPLRTIPGLAHRVITLNSFSKNFLMTGWRVGVAIAEPEILEVMSNINNSLIYTAPSISQRAAIQALAIRQTIREKYVLAYRDRIFYAADRMEQIPYLSLVRPKGTFYLFPGIEKTGLSAEDFCQALLERAHVLVTPGTLFGSTGAGHFRIACTVGLDRLKEAFDRMEGLSF